MIIHLLARWRTMSWDLAEYSEYELGLRLALLMTSMTIHYFS
ncbi:hypothetical protein AAJP47_07090 [Psychrobacter sp. B38]